MNYEYKCTKCKRPADYEVFKDKHGHTVKRPAKQCGNKRCNGNVELMYD